MGYIPSLSLPSVSLIGRSALRKVRLLQEAGFTGIEVFLFSNAERQIKLMRSRAPKFLLSLHQPWSVEEAGNSPLNRVLDVFGYLPQDGYKLSDITKCGKGELFVAYVERYDEVRQAQTSGQLPVRVAFQTACSWDSEGETRKHRLPYEYFLDHIVTSKFPIVFDTFHVLEWKLKKVGKKLAILSEELLAQTLIDAWHEIGPELIVEIHWNDVDGSGPDGRCVPGDGKLKKALRLLAREIARSGWKGQIVPEVSPFVLFPNTDAKLVSLRKRIEQFFE